MINIAVDGPAGAGKSSVSRLAAKELGLIYVDTGALYRAVGLKMLKSKVDCEDAAAVKNVLAKTTIDLENKDSEQAVILDSNDVTGLIRTREVSMAASCFSALPAVRDFLLETQKKIAREKNVIMDGRDIGTVVLPDAQVKVFLTASAEKRAERRCRELIESGQQADFEGILREINERDYNDMNRPVAPLRRAEDAVLLDTTDETFAQSVESLVRIIRNGAGI